MKECMAEEAVRVVRFDVEDQWAERINGAWRKSVESIIETGRLIAAAKADLDHGRFLEMVKAQLPFGRHVATRLMAIAQHPMISNGDNYLHLPASYGTLYELTRWEEPELKLAIGNRLIAGDTKRSDLRDIRTRVRRTLRGQGAVAPRPAKKIAEAIQFVARLRRHLSPEQVEALNSLDEGLANHLCMEITRIINATLEE